MAADFVQRARSCVEQGNLQEAVRVCRLGLLANPNEVEGRVALGQALLGLSRLDEALAEVKSALSTDSQNPGALALESEVLRQKDVHSPVAVVGPSPYDTQDIDPELEGVEIREEEMDLMEVSLVDLIEVEPDRMEGEPEIEELDPGLLMEATPTPIPLDDDLFLDVSSLDVSSGSPILAVEPQEPQARGLDIDMEVIRHGLTAPVPVVKPAPAPMPSAPPTMTELVSNASRRRVTSSIGENSEKVRTQKRRSFHIPQAVWGGIAILAIAAGIGGGLKIRDMRLGGQVRTAQEHVRRLIAADGYEEHRKARDWIARMHKAERTDRSLARLAAAEARLSGEFGDDPAKASGLLRRTKNAEHPYALEAAAYLALADGDGAKARANAERLIATAPQAWAGHYLLARAALLAGDADAAKSASTKALEYLNSPLGYVALARAEAMRSRYPEALAALGKASSIAGEHPAMLLWQARILVAAGELPKNPSDPDDLIADVISRSRQGTSVSKTQGAWAGLVLAQLKLERGDRGAAKKALAEANVGRPGGWMFSEMLTDILIRLGELDRALAEAKRGSEKWPTRIKPKVSRATIRLMQGDPSASLNVLEEVAEIENEPQALMVRGRVHLLLGQLGRATTDLDRALKLRPRTMEAVIARAQVDILRGHPKAAISRLEPMYDRTAGPKLAVAYAAALRNSDKRRQARNVLEPLVGKEGGEAGALIAIIELARLERSEGRFEEARRVFGRATQMAPHSLEAHLGAARLDLDDGRVSDGRRALDTLVAQGTYNAQILLACARARTLAGDSIGAAELLDQVGGSWLSWNVARERGRILLRRRAPLKAISELQRAKSLRSDDSQTWLLLMEAHFEAADSAGSAQTLKLISKKFPRSATQAFAKALHALLLGNAANAVASFSEARSLLIDTQGSRLRLAEVAYWLGRSYERSEDLQQAAQWLQKANTLNDAYAMAYFWEGQVRQKEQDFEGMASSYEKALAIDADVAPIAWYLLGRHYASVGKTKKAVSDLEKFLQHSPEGSPMVLEAKSLLEQLR